MRADARRNRERVLTCAREAFAEHGIDLQMEELARLACVGVGTVYRHFPSKEALLDALLADHFAMLATAANEALERDDPWEALCDVIRLGAERQAVDSSFCDAMWARKAVTTSPSFAALRVDLEDATAELIQRAQAAGDMRPDFTVDDLPMFFASLTGAVRSAHDHPELDWRRQLQFLLDGLKAPSSTSAPATSRSGRARSSRSPAPA
jgi:AcrR family transcriptional regulator